MKIKAIALGVSLTMVAGALVAQELDDAIQQLEDALQQEAPLPQPAQPVGQQLDTAFQQLSGAVRQLETAIQQSQQLGDTILQFQQVDSAFQRLGDAFQQFQQLDDTALQFQQVDDAFRQLGDAFQQFRQLDDAALQFQQLDDAILRLADTFQQLDSAFRRLERQLEGSPRPIVSIEGGPAVFRQPAETTSQAFQEVSVTRFEDPGYWSVHTPSDNGFSIHTRRRGGPFAKEPLAGETPIGYEVQDDYVLGVRTDFLRRGITTISVRATRPISIPGITQEVSVWVAGRERKHRIWLVIRDVEGALKRLPASESGTLNFRGWRQLTFVMPPFEEGDGFVSGIKQYDPQLPSGMGIEVVGLDIEPDFLFTYGSYYVYFDDMRATTDLFSISSDPDDPSDGW